MANNDAVASYQRNRLSELVGIARERKEATILTVGEPRLFNFEFKKDQSEQADSNVVKQAFQCVAHDAFNGVKELARDAQKWFDAIPDKLAQHFLSQMDLLSRRCIAIQNLTSSTYGPSYDFIAILTRSLNSTGPDVPFEEEDIIVLMKACVDLDRGLKKCLSDEFPIFSDIRRDGQPIPDSNAVKETTAQLKKDVSGKRKRVASPFSPESEYSSSSDTFEQPRTPPQTVIEPPEPPPAPRKRARFLDRSSHPPKRKLFSPQPKAGVEQGLMKGQVFSAAFGGQVVAGRIISVGETVYGESSDDE